KIGSRNHCPHARQRHRLRIVDPLDQGVSKRTAFHPTVEKSRKVDISAVLGAPGNFIHSVRPDGPRADYLVLLRGNHGALLSLRLTETSLAPRSGSRLE